MFLADTTINEDRESTVAQTKRQFNTNTSLLRVEDLPDLTLYVWDSQQSTCASTGLCGQSNYLDFKSD